MIRGGAVLYRDVFDNKPPLIHLVSALGWWIAPDPSSVWRLEVVALFALAGCMFAMLRVGFGFSLGPSLVGLAVGLVTFRNPDVFSGGGLTEEYGILFQTAGLAAFGWAAYRAPSDRARAAAAFGAGACAALMLFARQSFALSLLALSVVLHLGLARRRHPVRSILMWEVAGFMVPIFVWCAYLWWTGAITAVLDLVRDSMALVGQPGKGAMGARLVAGLGWMVQSVFDGRTRLAWATLIGGVVVVFVGQSSARRRDALSFPPFVVPIWFFAELTAVAAPAEYYGHQYLPFVPIWSTLAALTVHMALPTAVDRLRWRAYTAAAIMVALLGIEMLVLDAPFRADPKKGWYTFAPNARLSPAVLQRIEEESQRAGWRSYVPLDTMAIAVLLDMPLHPATRFINQYAYQFTSAETARAREFLEAIGNTDMVVEEKRRQRLGSQMEQQIGGILRSRFVMLFDTPEHRFYARRTPTVPPGP